MTGSEPLPQACRELLDLACPGALLESAETIALGPKSRVVRCRLARGPAASVVLKHQDPDGAHLPGSLLWFDRERSSHAVLGRLADPRVQAPRVLAADRGLRAMVYEDLAHLDGDYCAKALARADPELAATVLTRYCRAKAHLHGLTAGTWRREDWACHRPRSRRPFALFPTADETDPAGWIAASADYTRVLARLGVAPAAGTDAEIREVAMRVEDPANGYCALGQGDLNGVRNVMANDRQMAWIDFDSGGFRHLMLEGAPEMSWASMIDIPEALSARLLEAYRLALGEVRADLADPRRFADELAWAWGWSHVFHVVLRLGAAVDGDWPRGASCLRQQCAAMLLAFHRRCAGRPMVAALHGNAEALLAAVRSRWPSEMFSLPAWSAASQWVVERGAQGRSAAGA